MPYLDLAHWIEKESTILVTDTFCVLTSVIDLQSHSLRGFLTSRSAPQLRSELFINCLHITSHSS